MLRRLSFRRLSGAIAILAATIFVGALPAAAQEFSIDFGGESLAERSLQLIALITVLSLAPSILVMVTSFTRVVVVLSLARMAMGVHQAPPNSIIISLALFLTAFIMTPTLTESYTEGVEPLMNAEIEWPEAFEKGVAPLHRFMTHHVREKDLMLFLDLSKAGPVETAEDVPLQALIPAFMISEMRRAFEIGFLVFVPFLVIDMVVASVLMSMGMMMLPPIMISLPFKIIFFVLVDGWYLLAGSLVQSFGV